MFYRFKEYIIFFTLLLVGFVYLEIKFVNITSVNELINNKKNEIVLPFLSSSNDKNKIHIFEVQIDSYIPQEVKLNIASDDKVREVRVNSERLKFKDKSKYNYNYREWKYGDFYNINLQSGKNILKIVSLNKSGNYSLKIKQNISIFDYILIFILIIYPLIALLYKLYLIILDKSKEGFFKNYLNITYIIIFMGVVLRLIYFFSYEYSLFQHDFPSHTDYIRFFAHYFEIAPPDKLIQAPQQPLYHSLAGLMYAFFEYLNYSEKEIFYFLTLFSLTLSIISLIFAYKTLKLITESKFIINITLGFLAFTPSLIYMSARINNDILNMTLAILALYYIIKSSKGYFENYFYTALIFTTLIFFTKLSSIIIVLTFFALLTITYMDNKKTELLKSRIYIFGLVGVFILGLTLLRVYLPVEGEFKFVNSGIFKGQEIGVMDINYFFSFNLSKLIELAQSYSYENKSDLVRRSFFTYQYGTMLFGEFNYHSFFKNSDFLKLLIQVIQALGVIFVVGFTLFFINFLKQNRLIKILAFAFIINMLLLAKFAYDFPSVCNTDFRYYSPSFLIIGLLIAIGLNHLSNIAYFLRKTVIFLVGSLFILETIFILKLVMLKG